MSELLDSAQKKELLRLARKALKAELEGAQPSVDKGALDERLRQSRGVFVTLYRDEQLRGCIGTLTGTQPLYAAVQEMVTQSALHDPRFPPVTADEVDRLRIEISVLSPPEKVDSAENIILGRHGVMVCQGGRRGVFLPQVAVETGWSKEQFLDNLCAQKAGIDPRSWREGNCELYVFSAEVCAE
ncbi:MAG: AmmeMemoRadiSam system protein A [Candidatus Omnitrophica bacterium]|nr:AmmeMemoRadiSam system protein A [Candidatus Omnitrophota bacterium]